ncbi:MAG: hypothetical protein HQK53_06950, partial [Oligoflexia bacterium]|nr:hypothetical protein [Oligoflexia bacterium]
MGQKIKLSGGGIDAAAQMLAAMDISAQKRIFNEICQRDPQMAEKIKETLITIDDLR